MTKFVKAKLKKLDDPTKIDKYRVAANITEYYFITKLILRRIPKFMMNRQLFHVKNVYKNVKNQHGSNDYLVTITQLLCLIHFT